METVIQEALLPVIPKGISTDVERYLIELHAFLRQCSFETPVRGNLSIEGSTFCLSMKKGANQSAAGAVAGELWATQGHSSLPDNVVLIGV